MTSPEIRVSTTNPQAEGQKSATETPTLRVPQPSTATDREALVALYRATNGAEWPDHRHGGPTNLNWLTDRPLGEWYGVTTDHNGRVIGLELSNVGVKGSVPPEIGNLSELRQLSMWGYGLTGPIPPELSRLTKLTELRLGKTRLTGPIPPELGRLTNLTLLHLSGTHMGHNDFGDVDDVVARRRKASDSAEGGLTGSIPPELGNLSKLTELDLRSNHLEGPIPPELGRLSKLALLQLSENSLTGSVSPDLGDLSKLEWFYLHLNFLTGPIPLEFGNLSSLREFYYSINPSLCLPPSLQPWEQGIERSSQIICEEVKPLSPASTTDRETLVAFYHAAGGSQWYSSNNWLTESPLETWYGVATDGAGRVTGLHLEYNNLTGTVAPEIGGLSELEFFSAPNNQLKGELPPSIGSLAKLSWLIFRDNEGLCAPGALQGWLESIETVSGPICRLQTLGPVDDREALEALYHATDGANWRTNFNWLIDAPLSEWYGVTTDPSGRVIEVFLTENRLSGEIPPELASLSDLRRLGLSGNQLSGEIPPELASLVNLKVLDLSDNQLSGEIPLELTSLANLEVLQLNDNQLSGEIPLELAGFVNLEVLQLNDNQLSGEIPPELAGFVNLEVLQLNDNQLSGEIPPELASLSNLWELHLGGNKLSGCVPEGLPFRPENYFYNLRLPFCDAVTIPTSTPMRGKRPQRNGQPSLLFSTPPTARIGRTTLTG